MSDDKRTRANEEFQLVRDVERDDPVQTPADVLDTSDEPHVDPGDTASPHGDPMQPA